MYNLPEINLNLFQFAIVRMTQGTTCVNYETMIELLLVFIAMFILFTYVANGMVNSVGHIFNTNMLIGRQKTQVFDCTKV